MKAYLTEALPLAPSSVDWTKGRTDWGMMRNDTLGDCTIAGVAHACQVWSLNKGLEDTILDQSVLTAYQRWCGYVYGYPSTDRGGIELDVLTDWKEQGFQGCSLTGFAAVDPHNMAEVQAAITLFGGLYIGIELPASAQQQLLEQQPWTCIGGPSGVAGSWGGHCVFVAGYDATGVTCITWGKLQKMGWDFWHAYVDECYALLSEEFLGRDGRTPSGLDLVQLQQDLLEIH